MPHLLPLLFVLFLLAGCADASTQPIGEIPLETPPGVSSVSVSSVTNIEVANAPHPVSLDALSRKEFNGSDLRMGAVLAENEAYVRHIITYRSGELTISGILNIPKGDGPFPLLILNHGYIDPAIYTNGRGLKREQDYLARRGFAVLHPDYRNHAFSDKDPDNDVRLRIGYIEDAINAVLAARGAELPSIDAERVGMLGHSMGGGVTLGALIVRPDLIDAAVLFAPVSADMRDNFERWMKSRREIADAITERFGSPEDAPAFWDGVSASAHLDRITAPVLIHHGIADDAVPLAWSETLEAGLRREGKDVTLHIYDNEPHEFTAAWPQVMERTAGFFKEQLQP